MGAFKNGKKIENYNGEIKVKNLKNKRLQSVDAYKTDYFYGITFNYNDSTSDSIGE